VILGFLGDVKMGLLVGKYFKTNSLIFEGWTMCGSEMNELHLMPEKVVL